MANFCVNCGRQLEDGEMQLTDRCQYCAQWDSPNSD